MLRVLVLLGSCVLLVWLIGCSPRGGRSTQAPVTPIQAQPDPVTVPQQPRAPQPKKVPAVVAEPVLDVLLARRSQASISLNARGEMSSGSLGPGSITLRAKGDRLLQGGRDIGPTLALRFRAQSGQTTFTINDDKRPFGGDLVVRARGNQVLICERLGLEDFLYGVLVKETGDRWPLEALKAQAVAARSYICAQWQRYQDRGWHLEAAERVDLAYSGLIIEPHPRLRTAILQTQGDMLYFAGMPLPAFFHSCSGGVTEVPANVWPNRRAPDGVTAISSAFGVVKDPFAQQGASGLNRPTVYDWNASIPLDALRWRLVKHLQPQKPVGAIQDVKISGVFPDSGRAAKVRVLHDQGEFTMDGDAFRRAIGSHEIRSTLWLSFGVVGRDLRMSGRGFGHGVGLSQVSAWAMAKAGKLAPVILRTFYPGAKLVRRY